MTAPWMEDARRMDLRQLIGSLTAGGGGPRRRDRAGPCPAGCGGSDVRVYAAREGWQRWQCYRCQAGGDAVDAVAYAVAGDRYTGQPEVRDWLSGGAVDVRRAEPEAPPSYPPRAEVLALLSACRALGEAEAWARRRGLRGAVPGGAIGTLPVEAKVPAWAWFAGRPWTETGHRYIVPACDAAGVVRSVRARRDEHGVGPKCVPPTGHAAGGLLLATRQGRRWLAGSARARTVVLVEGEPAWLAGAARWEQHGVPVVGIVMGSATDATRAAILGRAGRVLLAIDDDGGRESYERGWFAGQDRRVVVTLAKDTPDEWSDFIV